MAKETKFHGVRCFKDGQTKKFWKCIPKGTLGGWHKKKPQRERIDLALASREAGLSDHDRIISAARALQALANVTPDPETRIAAADDAKYLYAATRAANRAGRKEPSRMLSPTVSFKMGHAAGVAFVESFIKTEHLDYMKEIVAKHQIKEHSLNAIISACRAAGMEVEESELENGWKKGYGQERVIMERDAQVWEDWSVAFDKWLKEGKKGPMPAEPTTTMKY